MKRLKKTEIRFFENPEEVKEYLEKQKRICKFYNECPSRSGWCLNRQPEAECVEFIITAYHNKISDIVGQALNWREIK